MSARPLPSVSFIIPVRDDARRLAGCLRSIAANRYPRELVDVLIVDNGSTDDSAAVATASGARVLHVPTGRAAELRNLGAGDARGEILAFVDADHQLDPGWLATLASCLESPDVAAAGAPYSAPPDGTWVQHTYDRMRDRKTSRCDAEWHASGNFAVRRQVFMQLGGFDARLTTCEDVDLCQRLHDTGYRILDDGGLRSIHLGDPSSLKGLFLSELWRGRDNLRATLRGPWTFRHLRSILVPAAQLVALAATVLGVLCMNRTGAIVALTGTAMLCGLSLVRAGLIFKRDPLPTVVRALQAFAVAAVYDLARALALVVRVDHRIRRVVDTSSHVPANSHS